MKTVPFFGLAREHSARNKKYLELCGDVLNHGQMVRGGETREFEETLSDRVGRKHAVAVNSGTDALFFALVGCGIGIGDKVLVTSFSFIASASSIIRAGATPVFCDVDPKTMQTSLISLKEQYANHADSVRAIVAVHLYGDVLDFERVERFAAANNLVLIEDAAQAFDAHWNGRPAGSMGRASALSFDPTKVVGSPGNGGALVTDDDRVAQRARSLRYHGHDPEMPKSFNELGYNSQMPGLVSVVLMEKMRHSLTWQARRQEIAAIYRRELGDLPGGKPLSAPRAEVNHTYHKFVMVLDEKTDRGAMTEELRQRGIPVMVHYPVPLPEHKVFAEGNALGDWRGAGWAARRVLSLPIHAHLTDAEVEKIINTVGEFLIDS